MIKPVLFAGMLLASMGSFGQETDTLDMLYKNSGERLIERDGNLTIGGYGEVHYNQSFEKGKHRNGQMDVHRLVLLTAYSFNPRTKLVTEIEFEHISEVYVEQAYLQYKINKFIRFQGGLLLIPMGIINEYHEPVTFNGVERPLIDQKISPSTWREIGMGFSGTILPVSLKYQLYMVNGFNGYDGKARLNGKDGMRGARQKGAESYISSPDLTARVEYFGIRGLNLGLSGYFGNTQSTLYEGIEKTDERSLAIADSSVVGISLLGMDTRYSTGGWKYRMQLYYVSLSNTEHYNAFTATDAIGNDLGSAMMGYYAELEYNLFHDSDIHSTDLIPFFRLEGYDTHFRVEEGMVQNDTYRNSVLTAGLGWKPAQGAMLKADIQFIRPASSSTWSREFNAGIAFMF